MAGFSDVGRVAICHSARGHLARWVRHPALGHPARVMRHPARGHPARGVRHPARGVRWGGRPFRVCFRPILAGRLGSVLNKNLLDYFSIRLFYTTFLYPRY